MLHFIRQHRWGIIVSIVVALVMSIPQLIAPLVINGYHGLTPMETDSEMHYWARVISARDNGHVGNPFLAYADEDFVPTHVSAESILAVPMRWLGGSADIWNIIYHLLLSFLLSLAVYYSLRVLFRDTTYGAFGVPVVVLGSSLLIWLRELVPLIVSGFAPGFLHFSRFAQPLFSGILFFLVLAWLASALFAQRIPFRKFLFVGVGIGVMAYLYIFYWIFLMVFVGVLVALLLFKKRIMQAILFIASIFIALVIDAPYLYDVLLSGVLHPETDRRVAAFANFSPQIGILLIVMTIVLALGYVVHRFGKQIIDHSRDVIFQSERWLFLAAAVISSWVVLNQQLVTGRTLQPGHFYWYAVAPLTMLIILFLWNYFVRVRYQQAIHACLVIVILFIASLLQVKALIHERGVLEERQYMYSGLHWLSRHTDPGDIIFADRELSNLIPVVLPRPVVYANAVVTYPVPQSVVDEGHYLWWWTDGLSVDDLAEHIHAQPEFIQGVYEPVSFRAQQRLDEHFLERETQRLLDGYSEFINQDPLLSLRDQHARYAVFRTSVRPAVLDQIPGLVVYEDTGLIVYDLGLVEKNNE